MQFQYYLRNVSFIFFSHTAKGRSLLCMKHYRGTRAYSTNFSMHFQLAQKAWVI